MKISHGRTYQNGEGSLIRIRKEKWDHSFVGIAEENGTFMGYYTESGTSYDNPCAKSQLIDEIACPKCGDWKRECGCNNMTEPTNSAEEAVRKAINRAIAEKDAEITRLTKLNQENYGDSEWYAREAESLRQQLEQLGNESETAIYVLDGNEPLDKLGSSELHRKLREHIEAYNERGEQLETEKHKSKVLGSIADERLRLLEQARADSERLREAAATLVKKLDAIHDDPTYRSVWTGYMFHGGDYSQGPTYVLELLGLRAAIDKSRQ